MQTECNHLDKLPRFKLDEKEKPIEEFGKDLTFVSAIIILLVITILSIFIWQASYVS